MTKQTPSRRRYSEKFKESILKRLEPPTKDTVPSLSKELNVPKTTIYQWIRTRNNNSKETKPVSKWSSKDKFVTVKYF
jgi:transposase